MKIYNYQDILNYFPYKYIDYSPSKLSLDDNGKRVVLIGTILEKSKIIKIKNNLRKYTFSVLFNLQKYRIIVFNRDYLYDNLKIGNKVLISGKFSYKKHTIDAYDIIYDKFDNLILKPKYHLIEDLSDNEFRKIMYFAFKNIDKTFFEEIIPIEFIKKYKLINKKQAYFYIHFANDKKLLKEALRYFKYAELLKYSMNMLINHNKMRRMKSFKRSINRNNINNILLKNNIKLTNDQIKVCKEIFNDIENNYTMYRILIGDVGCGKTLVAALCMAGVANLNLQSVLLCPTDILARQHYNFLSKFLSKYEVGLLVSNIKEKEKIKENIRENNYNIVIGTTALLEDDVVFNDLGLVIIDEQHKFGVNQRQKLISKGKSVDVLYMSATPIPRSLALSFYGELDISMIKEYPKQKRDVQSFIIKTNNIKSLEKRIGKHLKNDEKIFVVCPLIDGESFKRNATSIYQEFYDIYKDEVCLIHGKLNDLQKNEIINNFKNNKFHILVATTVIEVGIDISDASVMIIFNADCYGLATLHQLRGRVGRNGKKAYCYFLCTNKNGNEKLQFLKENNDGFKISEYDLHHRGPGELEGYKQSGVRNFIFSDIENDSNILELAYLDAKKIIKCYKNRKEYLNYVTKL